MSSVKTVRERLLVRSTKNRHHDFSKALSGRAEVSLELVCQSTESTRRNAVAML